MQKLSEEFRNALKVQDDKTITTLDEQTQAVLDEKPVRIVLIQDIDQNYQHAAVIVERLGSEAIEFPKLIQNMLKDIPQYIHITSEHAFIGRSSNDNKNLVFTNSVYLYTSKFEVTEQSVKDHFARFGMRLITRDDRYWAEVASSKLSDVFICHDSRDKELFVRPLADALGRRLLKVWYDEFSLKVGDSLIEKIEEGLQQCTFGIVVISKNFLTRKSWTNREFRSLTTRELNSGRKVILPIWLDVDKEEVS
jgi:hypothetical protein